MCFETLLSKLAILIEEHILGEYNCSNCSLLFREKVFKSACQTIVNMTKEQNAVIVEAIRCYPEFLETGAMYYVKEKWGLEQMPRPVHEYEFL